MSASCSIRTVLLVEPDNGMRGALAGALGDMGYRVHCARSGGEAVQWSQHVSTSLQLAVIEVELPDFSGVFVADHLLISWPDVLMLLTAWQPVEHLRASGHEVAGKRFIKKPVRLRQLRDQIQCPEPAR